MIDVDGYRPNVGIILCDGQGRVFWARRLGKNAWQFPQGGIQADETPEGAMYRELAEEIGLAREDVEIVGCTRGWLRYRLPPRYQRRDCGVSRCIGQKQVWFLLRLVTHEDRFRLDASSHPEFDTWRWVDYWHPLREVIFFKRRVYRCALEEFAPLLFGESGLGPPLR